MLQRQISAMKFLLVDHNRAIDVKVFNTSQGGMWESLVISDPNCMKLPAWIPRRHAQGSGAHSERGVCAEPCRCAAVHCAGPLRVPGHQISGV